MIFFDRVSSGEASDQRTDAYKLATAKGKPAATLGSSPTASFFGITL